MSKNRIRNKEKDKEMIKFVMTQFNNDRIKYPKEISKPLNILEKIAFTNGCIRESKYNKFTSSNPFELVSAPKNLKLYQMIMLSKIFQSDHKNLQLIIPRQHGGGGYICRRYNANLVYGMLRAVQLDNFIGYIKDQNYPINRNRRRYV